METKAPTQVPTSAKLIVNIFTVMLLYSYCEHELTAVNVGSNLVASFRKVVGSTPVVQLLCTSLVDVFLLVLEDVDNSEVRARRGTHT